jgi:hypothetical protein
MANFSTPSREASSRLGSSDTWKKYFPGLATGAPPINYAFQPSGNQLPPFKGIDFATGKTVDLGKYAYASPEPLSNELTPPAYSTEASPYKEGDLDRLYDKYRNIAREQRAEDYAYNMAMLDPLQNRVLETAYKTRQWDLANRMAGERFLQNLPNALAERSALAQGQLAQASGSFATELGAVSDAAYKAAMAQAQGFAPRGRAA